MHGKKTTHGGNASSVGTERHRLQVAMGVTADDLFPAGLRIPHLHDVIAASNDSPTVGAELNISDHPAKTQCQRRLPRVQIPNLQFPFLRGFSTACRDQALTVWAECDTPQPHCRVGVFEAK